MPLTSLLFASRLPDPDCMFGRYYGQIWDLGHGWPGEVPQSSTHVLPWCPGSYCCLWYHKSGKTNTDQVFILSLLVSGHDCWYVCVCVCVYVCIYIYIYLGLTDFGSNGQFESPAVWMEMWQRRTASSATTRVAHCSMVFDLVVLKLSSFSTTMSSGGKGWI